MRTRFLPQILRVCSLKISKVLLHAGRFEGAVFPANGSERFYYVAAAIRLEGMGTPNSREITAENLHKVVDQIALTMPLATSDQPFGPRNTVYRISGKIFAMYTDGIGYPIVNLKTDPEESEVLRRMYPSIIPGWHMNKRHWISVGAGKGVTRQLLEELIEDAYLRIMYALPKAKRPIEFRERPVPAKH